MEDIIINCAAEICYWNIGEDCKNNCARSEIDISEDGRCQSFVTKEVAKHRLKIAAAEFRKKVVEKNARSKRKRK